MAGERMVEADRCRQVLPVCAEATAEQVALAAGAATAAAVAAEAEVAKLQAAHLSA